MKFQIAQGASIHLGCKFGCTKYFSLGKNSTINQNCHLDNRGGLFFGKNVSVSARCAFITADHIMESSTFEGRGREVTVDCFVFIGYGATILGGVILGRGSVIAAGGLINKSTEAYGIYAGVPAKKIKTRSSALNYTTNYKRLFH
ncbi:acyltransferase [Pedobacter arcticus]|uniref:acyltransferase n=1 Tax=Pedobacter arcticus TaxID=752140 RepID=UPI00035F83DC|nr:acyltransferase [Pedobacter arcticus]